MEIDFNNLESIIDYADTLTHNSIYEAKNSIDKQYSKGYADEHPELVASYMQAFSRNFQTVVIAKKMEDDIKNTAEVGYCFADKVDKMI